METGPAIVSGDVHFVSLELTIAAIYQDVDFARTAGDTPSAAG